MTTLVIFLPNSLHWIVSNTRVRPDPRSSAARGRRAGRRVERKFSDLSPWLRLRLYPARLRGDTRTGVHPCPVPVSVCKHLQLPVSIHIVSVSICVTSICCVHVHISACVSLLPLLLSPYGHVYPHPPPHLHLRPDPQMQQLYKLRAPQSHG